MEDLLLGDLRCKGDLFRKKHMHLIKQSRRGMKDVVRILPQRIPAVNPDVNR
jgi:hypothetical protein